MEHIDTIVIGAGQAGLSASYWLKQAGREHLVLEQAPSPANAWRTQRWDSFTLVSPNWTVNLPGMPYDGPEPDGFMTRHAVIDHFDRYVTTHGIHVQSNTRVDGVSSRDDGRFDVDTESQRFQAENVVVATGFEQFPKVPQMAQDLPDSITQFHSSEYRNPGALPPGAVLVIGSAQSGTQIAEELYQSGRKVYLSIGSAGRAPRRYRGRDVFAWLDLIGFFNLPPDRFPGDPKHFSPPHLSGKDGGHDINLHKFASDGVTLLGHVVSISGNEIRIASDMHASLAEADGFSKPVAQLIDQVIAAKSIEAPDPQIEPPLQDGFSQPQRGLIDLSAEGITSVIWATGYGRDFSFVNLPVTDERGFLIQDRGMTPVPGLSFVGMPWTPGIRPLLLLGAGDSARQAVEAIVERRPVSAVA